MFSFNRSRHFMNTIIAMLAPALIGERGTMRRLVTPTDRWRYIRSRKRTTAGLRARSQITRSSRRHAKAKARHRRRRAGK